VARNAPILSWAAWRAAVCAEAAVDAGNGDGGISTCSCDAAAAAGRRDSNQGHAHRLGCLDAMPDNRSDEGLLAQELGRVIGGALGTRVERQAF
jgi:hypothetical protein